MISKEVFGPLPDGRNADLFSLRNQNGVTVKVTNLGAALVSVMAPDRDGVLADVVLGYDKAHYYAEKGPYHGVIAGRVANRIEDSVFTLNGKKYHLTPNFEGKHVIHGGLIGVDTKLFDASMEGEQLVLHTVLPDGEDGFPGNVDLKVIYRLGEENDLSIRYLATTDADTPMNLTNHSYFNLGGHNSGKMLEQELQIFADYYNCLDDNRMVCGKVQPVEPEMDFREMKRIGRDIKKPFKQLQLTGGYDHNYVLPVQGKELVLAARAKDPKSGRMMQVYTNLPGILLYTGNNLGGADDNPGKGGKIYTKHEAFCLETGFYPNSLKYPNFPQPILRVGETYDYTTIYQFGLAEQ